VAADSAGCVFVLAYGEDTAGTYSGVVRYDPADGSLTSIVKDEYFLLPGTTTAFDNLDCIAVSPVTVGRLQKDHLVAVWNRYDAGGASFYLEIESLSPAGVGTQVLTASGGGQGVCHLAIDRTSGDLYLLEGRANASPNWSAIRRFHWNGSGYAESAVTSAGAVRGGLTVGPAGYLYSFDASAGDFSILRIDPAGFDSWTTHAAVETSTNQRRFQGWGFDSGGRFWLAMDDFKVKRGRVTNFAWVAAVPAGGTVRARDRIAETLGGFCLAFQAGPSDQLQYIEEVAGSAVHTVYSLVPQNDGGGGKGGGKGKNK
jgi:hypothetical protein